MKKIAAAAFVLLAPLALAACGGGGGDTTASPTAAKPPVDSGGASSGGGQGSQDGSQGQGQGSGGQGQQGQGQHSRQDGQGQGSGRQGGAGHGVSGDTSAHFAPRPHHDSGGGPRQFVQKGGDNSIQEFGSEAGSSDFAAATTALHAYLDARAAHAWAASCEYLVAGAAEQLAQLSAAGGGQGKQPSCAEVLAGLSAGVPDAALREAAQADAAALRTEGGRAFLIFKGAGGTYFMPMAHEGGAWKVAAIAPSALP